MCLIVVGWHVHPDYPLIVAANRDEFYARPTASAARWPDDNSIMGGIDLEAGGTWLGISESGRFSAVTNVREPGMPQGSQSRGALPRDFLRSTVSALTFARQISHDAYSGFNLLLSDGDSLVYCSNRSSPPRLLSPGIYGLSNHLLDSPWPKLLKARQAFAEALRQHPDEIALFELLADQQIFGDDVLPKTGVPLEWERLLSAIFVSSENYGTRASTVLWRSNDGHIRLHEKCHGPNGQALQSSVISTSV